MNIETPPPLLETLLESQTFKHNPVKWILFYSSVVTIGLMFIILCTLSVWSISIGNEISILVTQASEILTDVQEMLPIIELICQHENFTKTFGNICKLN